MTAGTWLKLVRNSVLAAALMTAAQVGIGSGVGIIDWQPGLAGPAGWRALLTWIVFMFAVGVLAGALVGKRFLPVRLRPARPFVRATAALAAGFGSLLALPVVWLPVAVAHSSVSPRPQLTVAIAAAVGVALGVVASLFALIWGPVAAGSGLTAAWVWVLALVSAGLSAMHNAAVTPGLGLLDAPAAIPPSTWWSGPFLMVGVAAVLGLAVAAVSGWRGATWPGVALSGVVGPALIAAAYLTTGWALALAGLTTSSGAAAPVVAALVASTVALIVSAAVAAPQQRRVRAASFTATSNPGPTPVPRPGRPRAIEGRRPLAITSTAESPYQLESSDPIYVAPPRASSSGSYSADPYSSGAFEVSSRAFDTISVPAPSRSSSAPAASAPPPVTPPTPPAPSRPGPKSPGPAVPPSPARPPAPGFAPSASSPSSQKAVSPARPEQPVTAFPGGSDASGLFPPVSSPPAPPVPTRPSYVDKSQLLEQGYAQPAGPTEPGYDERVYRMPAPGSTAKPKPLKNTPKPTKSKGRAASPPPAPPAPAPAPASSEPTLRVPSQPAPAPTPAPTPPSRSPVADPAPAARPAPAAGPVPAQPTTGRGRKAARAAAAAAAAKPVPEPSSLRAGSIEGEVLSESTSPTSGGPTGRRGRVKDRPLRKGEREHIDWVTNLVQIEHDAVLKTSKDR